jgi:hypothetical protein
MVVAVVGVLAAYALRSLGTGLDQSLWKDETHSVVTFIDPGPHAILGDDYEINNHILFNLAAWATSSVFGRTETIYRLWSVLPGLAAIVVLWLATRRSEGFVTANVAAFVLIVSPLHTVLSKQARGYGLAYLAMALVVAAAIDMTRSGGADRRHAGRSLVLLATGGLIGVASFVLFALPFAFVVLALFTGRNVRRVAQGTAVVGLVGIAALALYSRGISQLLESGSDFRHHRELPPASWRLLVTWPRELLEGPFVATTQHIPRAPDGWTEAIGVWAVAVPLLALGVLAFARRGDLRLAAALLAPIFGVVVVFAGAGLALPRRYWASLLVPLALVLGVGVAKLCAVSRRALVPTSRARRSAVVALGAAGFASAAILLVGHLRLTSFLNRTPLEDYKSAGEVIDEYERRHGTIDIVIATHRTEGVRYYVGRPKFVIMESTGVIAGSDASAVPVEGAMTRAEVASLLCTTTSSVALVLHNDDDDLLDLTCVVSKGGELHAFAQVERGGRILIALMPASGPRAQESRDSVGVRSGT